MNRIEKLKDKNILIILPFYFEYQNQISNCLEGVGAKVCLINENVNELSMVNRLSSIYCKKIYYKILRTYYKEKFKQLPQRIDYVLVIKGSTLSDIEMRWLKEKYDGARYIIYQWDSIANYPEAYEIAKWFEYKYTFDPEDARQFGWNYRALFFDPSRCGCGYEKKYDVSFVASLHSKRAQLYQNLKTLSEKKKLHFFGYLFSDKWSFIRQKYIKRNEKFKIDMKDVKFYPLSSEQTNQIYEESRCVADYKFDSQVGLTMRTIESIGHRCKLVTNNVRILEEDFYDPNNIFVYHLEKFEIPDSFLESEYHDISEKLYYKYSIQGWIEEIFNLEE